MIIVWMASAFADEPPCETVILQDIIEISPPAILVLGERHGTQPDLSRARKLIRSLRTQGPITLALEAVHESKQSILDRYRAGQLDLEELPDALDWNNSWGFPWKPYESLLLGGVYGDQLIAAGPTLSTVPAGASDFPVPSDYLSILSDTMAGHEVPPAMQDRFIHAMAWRDWRIVDHALTGWNEEGYLIILAGRNHVEGGKGVSWQVQQRTDTPVHAFLLGGSGTKCYSGDRVWKRGIGG